MMDAAVVWEKGARQRGGRGVHP